jgi:membrane associated rhomboid family serine protease
MITILIGINVIVFVLDMFSPAIRSLETGEVFGHELTKYLALSTTYWYFPWTWLTHGFAHASIDSRIGLWHIAGNMLTLFFLGRPIEQRLGRWEFLKFYLLAILAGGAGFYLANFLAGWPPASVLGASGAVSAVVALFIFYYPRQTLLIWGVLPVPAWLLGVIMLLTNLKYALVPGSGISWEAHLAGAAFGLAYFWFGWNFSRLQMPQSIADKMAGHGALKIHNPSGSTADEKLTQQADAILEKINLHGEDSLTGRERKLLKRYSEMVRQQRH